MKDIFENIGPDFEELCAHRRTTYARRHPFKMFWHRLKHRASR